MKSSLREPTWSTFFLILKCWNTDPGPSMKYIPRETLSNSFGSPDSGASAFLVLKSQNFVIRQAWVWLSILPLPSCVVLGLSSCRNGNPLQYSCLENPMDGGAWCPWGQYYGQSLLETTESNPPILGMKTLRPREERWLTVAGTLIAGPLVQCLSPGYTRCPGPDG